jgi:hypothetical protein
MAGHRPIRLPKQWSKHVKAGVLHAISLASVALAYARGRTPRAEEESSANEPNPEYAGALES